MELWEYAYVILGVTLGLGILAAPGIVAYKVGKYQGRGLGRRRVRRLEAERQAATAHRDV